MDNKDHTLVKQLHAEIDQLKKLVLSLNQRLATSDRQVAQLKRTLTHTQVRLGSLESKVK